MQVDEVFNQKLKPEELIKLLGQGNIGVIPLPSRFDNSEQMTVNYRGNIKEVNLLVFGGISYKTQKPSKETFQMKIDMEKNVYECIHLPQARLQFEDRFIDNQSINEN